MVDFFPVIEFWQAGWNASFGKVLKNSVHGVQSHLKYSKFKFDQRQKSACIAKCMSSINKIYIFALFVKIF